MFIEILLVVLIIAVVWLIKEHFEYKKLLDEIKEKLIGSSTKGEIGERVLKNLLQPLIDANLIFVDFKIPESNKTIEFAYKIDKNKFVPIDSKWDGQPRQRIDEVKEKYIGKENTTPFGILCVPDKNFEMYEKNLDYAKERGVFIIKNSAIFCILGIISRFYENYKVSDDITELTKEISNWQTYCVDIKKCFDEVEQKMNKLKQTVYRNDTLRERCEF